MPSMTAGDVRPPQLPTADHGVIRLTAACAEAGISTSTMRRLRAVGQGPRLVRLSARCLGVRRVDLDEWLTSRVETGPSIDRDRQGLAREGVPYATAPAIEKWFNEPWRPGERETLARLQAAFPVEGIDCPK